MAVSLPSDIVFDVMKAADPQAIREARQTLAAKAAPSSPVAFEQTVAAAQTSRAPATEAAISAASERKTATAFQAVILQNLFKEMMPAGTTFGGSGLAGDMWESMFVDTVAQVTAQRDGLGLSSRLLGDTVQEGDGAVALEGARDFRAAVAESAPRDLSSALVVGLQRSLLSAVGGTSRNGA